MVRTLDITSLSLTKGRIPQAPPLIEALPDQAHRPLFSVMIPTYNCTKYVRQAIESVLCQYQGPEEMQIEVVDDCSEDRTIEKVVKEAGKGIVGFYQKQANGGSLRNFETCIKRARGHYVHLLHGDDFVKCGFYDKIKSLFSSFPAAGAAITNYSRVDEDNRETVPMEPIKDRDGIIDDWLCKIASRQMVQPPAVVVKREVYERLGSYFGVEYGEDWEMWVRIASAYPVAYSPKALATYRGGHHTNISTKSLLSGDNVKDLLKVMEITQKYLPENRRRQARKLARKNFSRYYTKTSYHYYQENKARNEAVAWKLARSALALDVNMRSLFWSLRLLMLRTTYPLMQKVKSLFPHNFRTRNQ